MLRKKGYIAQDRWFQEAKRKGLRSRAAFKLAEIVQKYAILKKGACVVDLGAAPGGWSQITLEAVGPKGRVIGVDLQECRLPGKENYLFIQGDIDVASTKERLRKELGRKADTLLSDMSPKLSGIKFQDHLHSYELAQQAFNLCQEILKAGGSFVAKIFPGEHLSAFKKELKAHFKQVDELVLEATRKTSNEVYLIARGFKGQ